MSSAIQAIPFAGLHYTGSVELGASDEPAPFWGWSEITREMAYMAAQLCLPGVEPASASHPKFGTIHEQTGGRQ